jgi:hypothetical protein
MLGDSAHGIIRDARGDSAANPSWIGEERVKGTVATIVEINVDTAIVCQDKVADGIGTLDGIGIRVKGLQEPGIFGSNEFPGEVIGPELRNG